MRVSGAMMTRLGRVRSPRTRVRTIGSCDFSCPGACRALLNGRRYMSWFSCRRNAAIRASLRRKNTHCPTLVAVIRPARCSTARCVDTVDWDSPQRPSMWPAQTPCSKVWRAFLEIRLGILQPRQDLAAHRVGERLEDGVGVDGWVVAGGSGIRRIRVHIQISQFIESYIVKDRYMLIPPRRVGILAAFARQLRLVDAMPPGSREPCALIHRPPCRAAA